MRVSRSPLGIALMSTALAAKTSDASANVIRAAKPAPRPEPTPISQRWLERARRALARDTSRKAQLAAHPLAATRLSNAEAKRARKSARRSPVSR